MNSYAGYLMAHFTGEHEIGEQVYFAVSRDGLHWKDLNGKAPVLMSRIGDKGIRDPFLVRSPIDNYFYIISTDLRVANGKGWLAAETEGSRDVIIWKSKDLVNWSEEWSVTVGVPGAGCVWAPEAVYDEEREAILVFWASNVQEEGEERRKQRIYAAYTKDFKSFTETFKYIEWDNNMIDTTILKAGEYYYRYSKDETTKYVKADYGKSLLGEFKMIDCDALDSLGGMEGPAAFRFNDRDEWCLIVDQFQTDKGYLPLVTSDPASGNFRILSPEEYDMGQNKKRHGSVLAITEEEYTRLVECYGIE